MAEEGRQGALDGLWDVIGRARDNVTPCTEIAPQEVFSCAALRSPAAFGQVVKNH